MDFARANAALAGLAKVDFQQSNLFDALDGRFELIVAKPPYPVDVGERSTRPAGLYATRRFSQLAG